jgi:hypothetical protein
MAAGPWSDLFLPLFDMHVYTTQLHAVALYRLTISIMIPNPFRLPPRLCLF